MNIEAMDRGLFGVTMTNPPGLDVGDHYVTALGFADLARDAMEIPCVRDIVGTTPWILDRSLPPNLQGFLGPMPFKTVFENGFLKSIQNQVGGAIGIKGGNTPQASKTGLYASTALGGEVVASVFGVCDDDDPVDGADADCLGCTGAGLLNVAIAECEPGFVMPPIPDHEPTPFGKLVGMPMDEGYRLFAAIEEQAANGDLDFLTLRRTYDDSSLPIRLVATQLGQIVLGPGETVCFGAEPYQGHEGARVVNQGANVASIRVTADFPSGTDFTVMLDPFDEAVVPGHDPGGEQRAMTWCIQNLSSTEPDTLEVHELGHRFDIALGDGVAAPGMHVLRLKRPGRLKYGHASLYAMGQNAASQDLFDLIIQRASSGVTGIDADPRFDPRRQVPLLLPNTLNPFASQTMLRFTLPESAPSTLRVFDLRGRLVRTLEQGQVRAEGEHAVRWDARDAFGSPVAAGVCVVELRAGSLRDSRRVTVRREPWVERAARKCPGSAPRAGPTPRWPRPTLSAPRPPRRPRPPALAGRRGGRARDRPRAAIPTAAPGSSSPGRCRTAERGRSPG
jgi:hypothetical protein